MSRGGEGAKLWKVLLADDVELFLELEKTFLQREDCTLLVARNGREALEIVRREGPHLALRKIHIRKKHRHQTLIRMLNS